ncbi:MAG: sporulation protein YqfD [Thermaerobacter sp.]|nr:sporulation protein YqfD [Thermaerobacter sp.]
MAEGIWLRLRFSGRQSAFFQAAQEASVKARRLRARGDALDFELPVGDVLRLRRTLRGQGGRLEVLGHGGWPLALRALRRRPWRILLPVLSVSLYFAAASVVWQVQVVGPKGVPVQRLLKAAQADGLAPGRYRFAIHPRALGLQLQNQVSGLIFCTVRIDGVRAFIYAAPQLQLPKAPEPPSYGPITAGEAGYVTRVVVERGVPAVKAGETVLPGQPLILTREGEARGEVFARVWRTYTYSLSLEEKRFFATGKSAQRWYIRLPWGRKWAPQGQSAPFPHTRVISRSWRIPWLSVELTRSTYVELRTVNLTVRPAYAKARAEQMALVALSSALPKAKVLLVQMQDTRQGTILVVRVRVEAETDIARAATGGRTQD